MSAKERERDYFKVEEKQSCGQMKSRRAKRTINDNSLKNSTTAKITTIMSHNNGSLRFHSCRLLITLTVFVGCSFYRCEFININIGDILMNFSWTELL